MKNFQVTAVDANGNTVNEFVTAEDYYEMTKIIMDKGLYIIDSEEVDKNTEGSVKKLKTKSLVIFCRQMSTMMNAGVQIDTALQMIQEKIPNEKERQIYQNLYEEVQKGQDLSIAMIAQQGAFPPLLIGMVEAGEESGTLDKTFSNMAKYYEKEAELNNKVKSAAMYPMILGVIAVVVVLILVVFVLPSITSMIEPEDMPATTVFLLKVSNAILNYWYLMIAGIIGAIYGFTLWLGNKQNRIAFDKMKLKLPVAGKLLATIYASRVANSMYSLYNAGRNIIDVLESTSKVIGNKYIEEQFIDVIAEVSSGSEIAPSIEAVDGLDPMLSSMISIGESSGALGSILESTADYMDKEANAATERLVALLEPIMIAVMGVMVGFIVMAIIQPMFQMFDSV